MKETKHETQAKDGPKASIRRTNPPAIYKPNGYTHVVEATGGRTIYFSGQTSVDKDGNLVGIGDFRAQRVIQVFENLKGCAGGGWRGIRRCGEGQTRAWICRTSRCCGKCGAVI